MENILVKLQNGTDNFYGIIVFTRPFDLWLDRLLKVQTASGSTNGQLLSHNTLTIPMVTSGSTNDRLLSHNTLTIPMVTSGSTNDRLLSLNTLTIPIVFTITAVMTNSLIRDFDMENNE